MSDIASITAETKDKMAKAIDSLKRDFSRVRTGRASPALLDGLTVDYYGQQTAISQVATVSVPDARTVAIQPWEKTIIGAIEKAIQASDLGLNPQSDGTIVRLPIPPLSEERRKELVKSSKKIAEDKKVAIRNIRRDSNDQLKKAEKNKDISQDEMKIAMDEIQKLTDTYIQKVDDQLAIKEKEILDV
jgi:ribosome recycling factor